MTPTTETKHMANGDRYYNGRLVEVPDSFEVILGVYKGDPEVVRIVTGHLHAAGSTRFTIRNVSERNRYVFPTDPDLRPADHPFILDWHEVATKIDFNAKARAQKADQSQSNLDEELSTKQEELQRSLVRYLDNNYRMENDLVLTDARETIATAAFLVSTMSASNDATLKIEEESLGMPDLFELPETPEDLEAIRCEYWSATMHNVVMLLEARRHKAPLKVTIDDRAMRIMAGREGLEIFRRYSLETGGEGTFVEWNEGGSDSAGPASLQEAEDIATTLIEGCFEFIRYNMIMSQPEDGLDPNELGVNEWMDEIDPLQ